MGNDNRKKEKKTDSSCDGDEEEVVCCKHGRPCRIAQAKSKEKQRNRSEEDQSEIVYENITENNVTSTTEKEAPSIECKSNKEASEYENIPDGGLGTTPEATARDDDEKSGSDEEEDVSTAKEQDDDTNGSGPPKSFKRSKAQNKV